MKNKIFNWLSALCAVLGMSAFGGTYTVQVESPAPANFPLGTAAYSNAASFLWSGGVISVGNFPGTIQLLSTNYIGAQTNSGGYFVSNAIFGVIQTQGITAATNSGVVTLTMAGPLQLLSTNYIAAQTNSGGLFISNAIFGAIQSQGLTITTNSGVITETLAGPLQLHSTNYTGAQTNSGGYFVSNSIFGLIQSQGLTITTNSGPTVTETLATQLQQLSTNYLAGVTNSGGVSLSNAIYGLIQSQGLTDTTNPAGLVTQTLATQLQQLSTNYMAGVTNSGGYFITNAIFGIIQSGATTNSGVVTLPAGSGTGIATNGGTGTGNILTNLTVMLSMVVSNPSAMSGPILIVTNWSPTIAQFNSNTNGFAEVKIKNYNNGGNASGDWTVEADNGDNGSLFLNGGVNSSGYSNYANVGLTNDGYIIFQSGTNANNFWIVNSFTNRTASFATGHVYTAIAFPTNIVTDVSSNQFTVRGVGGSVFYGDNNNTNYLQVQVAGVIQSNAYGTIKQYGDSLVSSNRFTGLMFNLTNGGGTFSNSLSILGSNWVQGSSAITGPVTNYNTMNVGSTTTVSNSLVVTTGGAFITGLVTNANATLISTNPSPVANGVWTNIVDANLPVQLFTMFTTNLIITNVANIPSASAPYASTCITLITNSDSSPHQVIFPIGTRIMNTLSTNSAFPQGSITCTNGKTLEVDWLFYGHRGQTMTNAKVFIQIN